VKGRERERERVLIWATLVLCFSSAIEPGFRCRGCCSKVVGDPGIEADEPTAYCLPKMERTV
jgi:hypothetical protein